MKTIKGPAIFLAQFIGDKEPYNTLPGLAKWASGLGYKGVQLPSWADHIFSVDKAAQSKDYCDEITGVLKENNLELTEISSHITCLLYTSPSPRD